MKNATLSLVILAAAAASQASVTARCIDISTTAGELSVGTPFDLQSTDGRRVSFRATRSTSSLYDYRTTITLHNPLLATGLFRRMIVKIVGRTDRTEIPLRILAIRPTGTTQLVAIQSMATFDQRYSFTLTSNVRSFISSGGVVKLHLFAFSLQPFVHRFDEVSVTFS
ncbi:MAG TPA: hypothetical protein PLL78_10430 [Fimbriimonadaceae bacterium]|nr:hypothetical protein [Fimbriimonadaceae bacterium]HRJ97091.1 hypothetical protein [Fimbriimonadaceae bacterium]